jgi:hypothetical protein
MKFPSGFSYDKLAHAANERIPINALEFGTAAIQEVLIKNHV